MRSLCVAVLLPLLLFFSDGWKDTFDDAWKAAGDDAKAQRSAIRALAGVDEAEVVTVLARTASKIERAIDDLEKQKKKNIADMRKLPADALVDERGRLINREGYAARRALDEESQRIENAILWQESLYASFEGVFTRLTDAAAIDAACEQVKGSAHVRMRYRTIRGLRKVRSDAVRLAYEDAAGDREGQVAVAALEGLRAYPKSIDAVITALGRREWQVQIAAALTLESYDDVKAIPPLLDALEKADGRPRREINDVLVALTGQNRNGQVELWRNWWEGAKDGFDESRPPLEKRREAVKDARSVNGGSATFYGIEVPSKRLAFVLDRSGSMSGRAAWQDDRRPVTGEGGIQLEGNRKIDVCRYELKKVIVALPKDAEFAILFYNRDVRRFPGSGLARANAGNVKKALKFIDAVEPLGATNIFDSLEDAMGPNWKSQVDTIFLLSDGVPNAGRFTHPDDITREIKRRNRESRVQINTVFVGTDRAKDIMAELAKDNDGVFVDRSK